LEESDRVLMRYLTDRIDSIEFHDDGARRSPMTGITVESVSHSHHGVQCYGLIFRRQGLPTWGVISDTAPMTHFASRYADCEILIVNTALKLPRARLDHMTLPDVESLLEFLHPRMAVITHMGNDLLDLGGEYIAKRLSTDRTRVLAAKDGMIINFENLITI
jgi:phosphoribosyl 1,2-cyclic phosphodiesterase